LLSLAWLLTPLHNAKGLILSEDLPPPASVPGG
jgi:hypothetical protein